MHLDASIVSWILHIGYETDDNAVDLAHALYSVCSILAVKSVV